MDEVKKIAAEIKNLKREEKLEVLEIVVNSLKDDLSRSKRKHHSLIELKGLGKDIWKDVDVEQYIDSERDSWNS
jgi:hypothetical protein